MSGRGRLGGEIAGKCGESQPARQCEESRVILVRLRVVVVAAGNRDELLRLVGRLEELPPHGIGNKPVGRAM